MRLAGKLPESLVSAPLRLVIRVVYLLVTTQQFRVGNDAKKSKLTRATRKGFPTERVRYSQFQQRPNSLYAKKISWHAAKQEQQRQQHHLTKQQQQQQHKYTN